MIKKILLITSLVFVFTSAVSQNIEITPYIGYTFGGKTPVGYGDLKVKSSESYGAALEILFPIDDISLQLEYFRQPTTGQYRDRFDSSYNQDFDMNIDWYHIGLLKLLSESDQIVPFIGLSLGATHFDLKTDSGTDEWSFSVNLQGGVKIYFSERIGLRLHARLLMPIQWGGFGFYGGSGGSGATVSAGTYFVQGDVGAGLIFRLGK